MTHSTVDTETMQFLSDLGKNNDREWFESHKKEFKRHQAAMKGFFAGVMDDLRSHDEIERMKMFRIYRDVRFSSDKRPYKTHFSCSFSRLGAHLRGGYYVHVEPGGSFLAIGFWKPEKNDLLRIRKEFEQDASEMRAILSNAPFASTWGGFTGEAVKTAPKGFDRDHPDIDLIRRKQFVFTRQLADSKVVSNDFQKEIATSFRLARPFLDLMSEVLTTDLNGQSLLD